MSYTALETLRRRAATVQSKPHAHVRAQRRLPQPGLSVIEDGLRCEGFVRGRLRKNRRHLHVVLVDELGDQRFGGRSAVGNGTTWLLSDG